MFFFVFIFVPIFGCERKGRFAIIAGDKAGYFRSHNKVTTLQST
jgi:hypothetical protein